MQHILQGKKQSFDLKLKLRVQKQQLCTAVTSIMGEGKRLLQCSATNVLEAQVGGLSPAADLWITVQGSVLEHVSVGASFPSVPVTLNQCCGSQTVVKSSCSHFRKPELHRLAQMDLWVTFSFNKNNINQNPCYGKPHPRWG